MNKDEALQLVGEVNGPGIVVTFGPMVLIERQVAAQAVLRAVASYDAMMAEVQHQAEQLRRDLEQLQLRPLVQVPAGPIVVQPETAGVPGAGMPVITPEAPAPHQPGEPVDLRPHLDDPALRIERMKQMVRDYLPLEGDPEPRYQAQIRIELIHKLRNELGV